MKIKKDFFIKLIFPLSLIILWELSVRTGLVPEILIAPPSKVFFKFFKLLFDFTLFNHSLVSLYRLFIGFVLGCALGIGIGLVVGISKIGSKLFEPTFLLLIPVPPLAWIPLLIIFFGIGDLSKILLISIGGFSTLFLETSLTIKNTPLKYIELARIYEKRQVAMLFKVFIPNALPNILSSMRVAMALSWTLLMASEIIASSKGLGWLIWDSRNFSRPDDMIVGMIAVGLLGKLSDVLLLKLEKRFTVWRSVYKDV